MVARIQTSAITLYVSVDTVDRKQNDVVTLYFCMNTTAKTQNNLCCHIILLLVKSQNTVNVMLYFL